MPVVVEAAKHYIGSKDAIPLRTLRKIAVRLEGGESSMVMGPRS